MPPAGPAGATAASAEKTECSWTKPWISGWVSRVGRKRTLRGKTGAPSQQATIPVCGAVEVERSEIAHPAETAPAQDQHAP
ncbi:hypothetical protein G6F58_013081 [Rhizopus delemar]|nr:hypothetical protein G6F58_013081 [Rhizopus delemar]